MSERPTKKLFPNPFYVLLLLASTAFVVTALGYLISPTVLQQAANRRAADAPKPGSDALAAWFDRRGPVALGVEFGLMLVFALLAMATDRWFPAKPVRKGTTTV
jgi:hypothetical protein